MEKSSFFNSVGGDRKYKAGEFAEYFSSFIGNGIFPNPSTNLQVVANNDMTVTLKAGKAWINGYFYINTDDLVLPIDVADGVLNRIDRVVVRMDTVAREIKAVVKKGTFASSPIAPVLQRDADIYELGIADIAIGKGVTSISQSNISDLRMNYSYCGIVKGTVDQIDTTNLFAQYDDSFRTWFNTVQDALDGDTAGQLLNLINANTTAIEDKADQGDLDNLSGQVTSLNSSLSEHEADNVQHITSAERTAWNSKAAGSHTHTPSQVGLGNVDNVKQLPIAGGTMTGALVAQNNANYTTKQVRNVTFGTSNPSGGGNGDIYFQYE